MKRCDPMMRWSSLGLAVLLSIACVAGAAERSVAARQDVSALSKDILDHLALQIALEMQGFSPGLLDGKPGPKSRTALAAYQTAIGLPATGEATAETLHILAPSPGGALIESKITAMDLREVESQSQDWIERSRRDAMRYYSLRNLLAERTHTSERFLAALNPVIDFERITAGSTIRAPAASGKERARPQVARIEIDLERKLVLLFARKKKGEALAGLLHISIAAEPARAPEGETYVKLVAFDPTYTFDPAKWPEVKGVSRKLEIPPGPRNPVGLCWIGLGIPGVGMHGSPEPENIGKTGSHGCFRLTNWDAVWLGQLVQADLPVRIVPSAAESSWPWSSDARPERD